MGSNLVSLSDYTLPGSSYPWVSRLDGGSVRWWSSGNSDACSSFLHSIVQEAEARWLNGEKTHGSLIAKWITADCKLLSQARLLLNKCYLVISCLSFFLNPPQTLFHTYLTSESERSRIRMYGGLLSALLLPCNSSDCTTGRRVYMAEGSQLIPGFTQLFSSVSLSKASWDKPVQSVSSCPTCWWPSAT